jgi:hypothetical protein
MKRLCAVLITFALLATLFGCVQKGNPGPAGSTATNVSDTRKSPATETFESAEKTSQPTGATTSEASTAAVSEPTSTENSTTQNQGAKTPAQPDHTKRNPTISKPSSKPNEKTEVSLTLDKSMITLDIGQTAVIKATVTPVGTGVTWSSGEDSIATVHNGTVTGKSYGATAIIVKAGGKEQRCTVIVQKMLVQMDVQPYVDYAISYGTSIGLIYDETLSGGSWNAWINLYSTLSDAHMKQSIEGGLQILVDEGHRYFKVHAEPQPNKSYHLFLYYG